MAILKTINLPNGIHVENAYYTITLIRSGRYNETNYTLSAFYDKEHSNDNVNELDRFNGVFYAETGDTAEDIKRQIYKNAKTLPFFIDGIDA